MCYDCYEEAGKPTIVNEKTKSAANLIAKVYEFSFTGGNLHIVIDDWNLEDDKILSCLNDVMTANIHESDAQQLDAERACLESLLALTEDERVSAMAIHDGFLTP